MDRLDRYEEDGLDSAFVDDVTEQERFDARAAAERELARRDALEGRVSGRRRGLPALLEGVQLLPCTGGIVEWWAATTLSCAAWAVRRDAG